MPLYSNKYFYYIVLLLIKHNLLIDFALVSCRPECFNYRIGCWVLTNFSKVLTTINLTSHYVIKLTWGTKQGAKLLIYYMIKKRKIKKCFSNVDMRFIINVIDRYTKLHPWFRRKGKVTKNNELNTDSNYVNFL